MRKTLGVAVVITWTVFSFAQLETATLTGRVTDPSGALIAGAQIVVTNMDTNVEVRTTTNSAGIYVVPNLHPARYRVAAGANGFRTLIKTDLVLHVQEEMSENFSLGVGSATESVTVTAESSLVNTESAAVGTVVDQKFVENLPLNGRSFQSLINLTPGVTVVAGGGPNVNGQFSVNGQRQTANSFMIDGVSANFAAQPGSVGANNTVGNLPAYTIVGTTQTLVSVDALQEFKVQTSTYAAEFGRQPGAQISMVTRSGTNQYHGVGFEYLRNEALNANDWFADRAGTAKPQDREHDFGGTLGGPIVIPHIYKGRNRTFFFFSYEGLRLKTPAFALSNVPSLCLRGLGSCAAGEVPAAAALQPILQGWPLPNGNILLCPAGATTATCGVCPGGAASCAATSTAGTRNGLAEFSLSYSLPVTLDSSSIRIDHTFNNKLTVFGRYTKSPSSSLTRSSADLGRTATSSLETETLTIGATSALTPTITNDFRVNYSNNPAFNATAATNLEGAVTPPRTSLVLPQFDTPGVQSVVQLFTIPGNTGGTQNLTLTDNSQATQRQYNIVDSVSLARGKHQFKFGVDFRRLTPVAALSPYSLTVSFGLCPSPAVPGFTCAANTRQQLTNGVAGTGSAGATLKTRPIVKNFSAYGEDTWKISRRLTLTLGLRWDVNPAPGEANGLLPLAVDQLTNLAMTNLAPKGSPEYHTYWKGFAPRFGAAYQVNQTPGHEVVVRGGFGVFYDTGNDQAALNFNGRYPISSTHALSAVAYPLVAAQVAPGVVPVPVVSPYGAGLAVFDPNLKLPYTLEWNFALEQGLGRSQSLTLSYVGAAARNLLANNFSTLFNGTNIKINPNFTTVTIWDNESTSNYNALQAQFRRRLSHNFQALVSYTWSHALANEQTNHQGYGNVSFDVRQTLGAAVTYDIPAPGHNPLVGFVLGHWSVDTNAHAQSALPVTVAGSIVVNPVDGSQVTVRGFRNPGVPAYITGDACTASNIVTAQGVTGPSPCPGGRRLNPAAFRGLTAAEITAATLALTNGTPIVQGDSGIGQFRALGSWQVDQALRREFKVTERVKLQLRAEAFNIFNHPNFGGLNGALAAANFGEPTQMLNKQNGVGGAQVYLLGGPRAAQLALKVLF